MAALANSLGEFRVALLKMSLRIPSTLGGMIPLKTEHTLYFVSWASSKIYYFSLYPFLAPVIDI